MKDETRLVSAGRHPEAHYGAVNTPVYRTSTILFQSFEAMESGEHDPRKMQFAYGRLGTPTSQALEEAVAELEGGYRCRLAPSGLAAITTALIAYSSASDHILIPYSAYNPTRAFADGVLARFGVETQYYEPGIGSAITQLLRSNTTIVYVESPGSGLFELQDVPAIAAAAHARGITVIMDNTWASPLYFKPFRHGVDVSIQAATKYIVGHSDAMLGTITCTRDKWPALTAAHRALGQMAGPDDIYLALRGLRTMAVRLERHHRNGLALARFLASRVEVDRVMHPALEGDPGYSIWRRDFLGASGLFGFLLKPGYKDEALAAMLNGLRLYGMGYSWGGYESLIAPLKARRFNPALSDDTWAIRIHAGLEDPDDLIEDLRAGLDRLTAAT
jgi:cysteine-S-conjugate beta-lyase